MKNKKQLGIKFLVVFLFATKLQFCVKYYTILLNYRTSLLQDIGTPAYVISFVAAAYSASSAIRSKKTK